MAHKPRREPIRSCVVCRTTSDKRSLLRIVRPPEKDGGAVAIDRSGKRPGRGAYVCPSLACIETARKKRRFESALSVPAASVPDELFVELQMLAAEATGVQRSSSAEIEKGA